LLLLPRAASVAAASSLRRAAAVPARAFRFSAPEGVVRGYRPRHFRAGDAGLVIYVHGLYTDVDRAWTEHHLPEQFAASGRNALFVVPAGRSDATSPLPWVDLETLLAAVAREIPDGVPAGPVVLAGHSGAYKQLLVWLKHPHVKTLLLLDAVYGGEPEFRAWLEAAPENRAALINHHTAPAAAAMTQDLLYAVHRRRSPITLRALTPAERRAKLLSMDTRTDHFAIVTGGRFLPLLLAWSGLPIRAALPRHHGVASR
jgi:hypothetical protein